MRSHGEVKSAKAVKLGKVTFEEPEENARDPLNNTVNLEDQKTEEGARDSQYKRLDSAHSTVSNAAVGHSFSEIVPKGRCVVAAVLICVLPSLTMFVLGYLVGGQWAYRGPSVLSPKGTWYLTSLGLASILLMVLIPYVTLAVLLEHMARLQSKEPRRITLAQQKLNDQKIIKVFEANWTRGFRACRICARALLNIFLFTYALFELPPRHPEQSLNQTKHVLGWLEFCGVWFIVLVFLTKDMLVASGKALGLQVIDAPHRAHLIRSLADFSALALLRLANPHQCLERLQRAYYECNIAVFLAELASAFFGAALGIAALVSKIGATAFISGMLFWDWDLLQWLTLLGLLNNIAGLLQIEELRIESWWFLGCFGGLPCLFVFTQVGPSILSWPRRLPPGCSSTGE